MNRGIKSNYVYGKTHHIKYPYKERVDALFNAYREKINKIEFDYRLNNLFVDLRNEAESIIDEIYQYLSIQLRHKLIIPPTRRKIIIDSTKPKNQSCQICGERRAIDKCHIIPRESGGDDDAGNMIYLCLTHHHLFDHCELSNEEFNKITLVNKKEDSFEYFNTIYKLYHQIINLLGTVPNSGCLCGVHSLGFGVVINDNYVCTCFMCRGCKKKYAIPFNGLVDMKVVKINGKENDINEAIENIKKTLIEQFGKKVITDILF